MEVIEISDERAAVLKARAAEQGLTLKAWIERLADETSAAQSRPLKSGRGMLARFGPPPSADEIDENRRDMFGDFARDY